MTFQQILKRRRNLVALHQIGQQPAADRRRRKHQIGPRQFQPADGQGGTRHRQQAHIGVQILRHERNEGIFTVVLARGDHHPGVLDAGLPQHRVIGRVAFDDLMIRIARRFGYVLLDCCWRNQFTCILLG